MATTNLIIEFGAKVQAATLAKAQATASTAASSTTIFAEQSEKTNLKSLSSEDLHSWGEKLKAKQVLTGRAATEAQLMSWTSERQRTVIGRAFRLYRFPDGSDIHNAENWLQWANSESICDIIKLVFPKTDAQSDSQILMNLSETFKIHLAKNNQHFLGFIADMMLALHFDERKDELEQLSSQAFILLKDIIVDQHR